MDSQVRILVVEDHAISQRIAYFVLKSLNFQSDYANTGEKALDLFSRNTYDLILMDLGLPDMNGLDVAKTIRELSKNTETSLPIVALTAHTSASYDLQSFAMEIDYFLEKPLTIQKVLLMIKKFIPHKYNASLVRIEPDEDLFLEMERSGLTTIRIAQKTAG